LTTPGGKASRKACKRGPKTSEPGREGLKITGLPIKSAGISVVQVSLRG
jgi:hypothetical protein